MRLKVGVLIEGREVSAVDRKSEEVERKLRERLARGQPQTE